MTSQAAFNTIPMLIEAHRCFRPITHKKKVCNHPRVAALAIIFALSTRMDHPGDSPVQKPDIELRKTRVYVGRNREISLYSERWNSERYRVPHFRLPGSREPGPVCGISSIETARVEGDGRSGNSKTSLLIYGSWSGGSKGQSLCIIWIDGRGWQ